MNAPEDVVMADNTVVFDELQSMPAEIIFDNEFESLNDVTWQTKHLETMDDVSVDFMSS